jgi:hypothetical protein
MTDIPEFNILGFNRLRSIETFIKLIVSLLVAGSMVMTCVPLQCGWFISLPRTLHENAAQTIFLLSECGNN